MPGFMKLLPPGSCLIRVGPECHEYADDWRWSIVLAPYDPACPTLEGAKTAPLPSEWRAVKALLRKAGFEWFRFDRMTSNGVESHVLSTHTRRAQMKVTVSVRVFDDNGLERVEVTNSNSQLGEAEAYTLRDYLVDENVKALKAVPSKLVAAAGK